ncbi:hypothetical protein LTR95_015838 [Oleoguttula sp. CCFEE 5521]
MSCSKPQYPPSAEPVLEADRECLAVEALQEQANAAYKEAWATHQQALTEAKAALHILEFETRGMEDRERRDTKVYGEDVARWNNRHWYPGLQQAEVTNYRAEVAISKASRELDAAHQRCDQADAEVNRANEIFERLNRAYGEEMEVWARYERGPDERMQHLEEYLADTRADETEAMSVDEPEESSADEAEEQGADEAEDVRAREAEADRASGAAVWEGFQQQHLDGRRRYEALAAHAQQMGAQAQQEEREKAAAFRAEFQAAWEKLQEARRADSESKAREGQQGGDPPSSPPPPPPPPPPPRDPGAGARRRAREAKRANFTAGFYRANAGHLDTPVPVSDPVQHWYTYAQLALANYSQLTAFPAPPVIVRCSSMACASSGRSLQACECNVRAALERLSVDQLSRVRKRFHPDRFSACAPILRAQFQQMAREVFVVANMLYRGRTRRPSVWQADPDKK